MSRGDGPYTHGETTSGPPKTARMTWEQIEAAAMRESIWRFLEPRP